jgi:hypothetical protein
MKTLMKVAAAKWKRELSGDRLSDKTKDSLRFHSEFLTPFFTRKSDPLETPVSKRLKEKRFFGGHSPSMSNHFARKPLKGLGESKT